MIPTSLIKPKMLELLLNLHTSFEINEESVKVLNLMPLFSPTENVNILPASCNLSFKAGCGP